MESEQKKKHTRLRVIIAIVACIGIYILHGIIMYGVFGFTSKDQNGIALPCSIGLMIALMGYVFRAIVFRKSFYSFNSVRVSASSSLIVVALCVLTAMITIVVCRISFKCNHEKLPIGFEIEVRKDGTWWRRMSKSEIEAAKQIPFEGGKQCERSESLR